jgi:hypothetical protein
MAVKKFKVGKVYQSRDTYLLYKCTYISRDNVYFRSCGSGIHTSWWRPEARKIFGLKAPKPRPRPKINYWK